MKIYILIITLLFVVQLSFGQRHESLDKLVPQLMTVPNAVDTNQDGALSTEEVMSASQNLLPLDKNGDGDLDWKEMGAWEEQLTLVRDHNITNLIDANGDIHITAEEIKNASNRLRLLDKNGDWQIDKKEIRASKPPAFPAFSNKKLSYDLWRHFRDYTTELEGAIMPGQDAREFKGYTLIHDAGDWGLVQQSDETYLLDEKGQKVHEWKHNGYSPEASVAYLLPNGQLLRTYSKHHWVNDKQFPVGATSTLELVDWDGNVLWEYSNSVEKKYSFHHDVEYLPNGNILAIRYNGFTIEEAMAMGWDPALGSKAIKARKMVWMSNVLELKPNLEDGSTEIIWQWNSWDHLVQNKYPDKLNYGDISNPNKIHINYLNLQTDVPYNGGQFFHLNTVTYNADLDMIMLSSPTYGEIWIIDHSTSIVEANGSTGGKYNKGGDLLYRYGNNEAFGSGTRDESILYWQHESSWIPKGLPGEGNILIFNNGNRRTMDDKYMKKPMGGAGGLTYSYSNILEIKPPMNEKGEFDINKPTETVWSWQDKGDPAYFSPFMSGAQRLPNGNTIFCRAYDKYVTEVTAEGEKVLDYSLEGWGRLYRIYKYEADYSGLKFK